MFVTSFLHNDANSLSFASTFLYLLNWLLLLFFFKLENQFHECSTTRLVYLANTWDHLSLNGLYDSGAEFELKLDGLSQLKPGLNKVTFQLVPALVWVIFVAFMQTQVWKQWQSCLCNQSICMYFEIFERHLINY